MPNRNPKSTATSMTAEEFIEGAKAAILKLRGAFDEFDDTADRLLAARPEPPLFRLHGNIDEPGGRPDTIETFLRGELLSAIDTIDSRELPSLDVTIDREPCDLNEENLRIKWEFDTAEERERRDRTSKGERALRAKARASAA